VADIFTSDISVATVIYPEIFYQTQDIVLCDWRPQQITVPYLWGQPKRQNC
jgi:hypothetical protein